MDRAINNVLESTEVHVKVLRTLVLKYTAYPSVGVQARVSQHTRYVGTGTHFPARPVISTTARRVRHSALHGFLLVPCIVCCCRLATKQTSLRPNIHRLSLQEERQATKRRPT